MSDNLNMRHEAIIKEHLKPGCFVVGRSLALDLMRLAVQAERLRQAVGHDPHYGGERKWPGDGPENRPFEYRSWPGGNCQLRFDVWVMARMSSGATLLKMASDLCWDAQSVSEAFVKQWRYATPTEIRARIKELEGRRSELPSWEEWYGGATPMPLHMPVDVVLGDGKQYSDIVSAFDFYWGEDIGKRVKRWRRHVPLAVAPAKPHPHAFLDEPLTLRRVLTAYETPCQANPLGVRPEWLQQFFTAMMVSR